MSDLDGNVDGRCKPYEAEEKECNLGVGTGLFYRKFRCYTDVTADDIEDHNPN